MLAHRRRLLEAVAGEPRRVEEPRDVRRLADERVPVGADVVPAPPGALHRQVGQHRQPPRGGLGDLFERALAPAEREPGPFAVEVEAGREVDRQRHALRQPAVLRREPHRARLALDGERDACERADLARPHARAADDGVGRDRPVARLDADDPPRAHVDAGRGAALPDRRARLARVVLNDRLRRRVAVARAVRRGEQIVDLELRHELARLRRRQLARRHAERLLQREARRETSRRPRRGRGGRDSRAGGTRSPRRSSRTRRASAGRCGYSARPRTARGSRRPTCSSSRRRARPARAARRRERRAVRGGRRWRRRGRRHRSRQRLPFYRTLL